MLKIQQERAKLDADVRLREIELAEKARANQDKVSNDDMKNIINVVDKLAKVQG